MYSYVPPLYFLYSVALPSCPALFDIPAVITIGLRIGFLLAG